jgi:hypothetical protein
VSSGISDALILKDATGFEYWQNYQRPVNVFRTGGMLSEWYCALRYKTSKLRQGKPTVHHVLWLLWMKGLRKAYKILGHHLDDASAWAVNVRDEEE